MKFKEHSAQNLVLGNYGENRLTLIEGKVYTEFRKPTKLFDSTPTELEQNL